MSKPIQHQIVARAFEIIEKEERWTRLAVARRANDRMCDVADPRAVRFCAIGALRRAAQELLGGDSLEECFSAAQFVLKANGRPDDTLPRINDHEGHAVIMAMFQRALAT